MNRVLPGGNVICSGSDGEVLGAARVGPSSGWRRRGLLPIRRAGRLVGQWRLLVCGLLVVGGMGCTGSTGSLAPSGLVLASWNLEHLAAADGAGCRARSEADYADLRAVAAGLAADVVALQEVENRAAVARVFDPSVYDILVSSRADNALGDCRGLPGQTRTAQRTGFAINRARLNALGLRWRALPSFREIGVDARRWGLRIRIEPLAGNGADARDSSAPKASGSGSIEKSSAGSLELVSLHLKSGCAWGWLDARDVRRAQCLVLRRQRGILEQWIDARAVADQPFVLMGDFNRQLDQPDDDFWGAIDDAEVCDWRSDPNLGRRCLAGSAVADADADLTLANAGVPFAFPYNPKYPYAVDHFVFDGRSAGWIIGGSYRALDYAVDPAPSDHHPIRITMQLPFAAPAAP